MGESSVQKEIVSVSPFVYHYKTSMLVYLSTESHSLKRGRDGSKESLAIIYGLLFCLAVAQPLGFRVCCFCTAVAQPLGFVFMVVASEVASPLVPDSSVNASRFRMLVSSLL